MGALIIIGGGLLALLAATRKKKSETDPALESQMIGQELAPLPAESRNFLLSLMLTRNPAHTADTYAQAIANAIPMGLRFTANKLTEIMRERFT